MSPKGRAILVERPPKGVSEEFFRANLMRTAQTAGLQVSFGPTYGTHQPFSVRGGTGKHRGKLGRVNRSDRFVTSTYTLRHA